MQSLGYIRFAIASEVARPNSPMRQYDRYLEPSASYCMFTTAKRLFARVGTPLIWGFIP